MLVYTEMPAQVLADGRAQAPRPVAVDDPDFRASGEQGLIKKEIELLQRSLAKLTSSMEEMEDTARELERQLIEREELEGDEAAALLRPQLDLGEGRFDARKRAYMKDIFEANVELRSKLG